MSWIRKNDHLPKRDMVCIVMHESLEEQWEAWYDNYYQAFFLPDYLIPIEVTHWMPKLKLVG